MPLTAERILKQEALLGEGALWHAPSQTLWWVDIDGHAAHRFDPATGKNQTVPVGDHCGTIVPTPNGGALVARGRGVAWLDFDQARVIPYPVPAEEPRGNRLNDGKCDPAGRLWIGGLSLDGLQGASHLHRLEPDGRWTRMLGGIGCSNGLVWTADGSRLYYIDTLERRVDAFDFDLERGELFHRRPVYEVPAEAGYPDGMAIDSAGHLWIALWGGGRVICIDPLRGRRVAEVRVAASLVTSCAFGGPRLDQLYITTARHLPPEQLAREPEAGSIFITEPGVTGTPAQTFGANSFT